MTGRRGDRTGGTVRLDRDGGVALIVIDNPPVNAGSDLRELPPARPTSTSGW